MRGVRPAVPVLLLAAVAIFFVRPWGCVETSDPSLDSSNFGGVVRLAAALDGHSIHGGNGADDGRRVGRRPVIFSNRLRDAIVVRKAGELRLEVSGLAGSVQGGAHGRVSIAAEGSRQTTVIFEVALRGPDGSRSLLREKLQVTPREKPTWSDHSFELPESAPGSELVFSVTFSGPPARAFWGAPVLFRDTEARRPNVILVSIDTLGARNMSGYGYERETTPELDRFAERSVVFEQAISHQSWTLTAHMSLFTSLYPDTHKVSLGTSLATGHRLLPELLRDAGYYTAGRVSNVYLSPKYGYGRAYDTYTLASRQSVENAADEVGRLLESPVPSPFFLFLHLIDPHSDWRLLPYDSPQAFRPAPPAAGWESVRTCFEDLCATRFLAQVNTGNVTLGEDVDLFRSLYDAGVRYTDHHLGALFDELERRGLLENSLVIITSDHGEEFLEHGKVMHTQGYDECLHVPLIVRFPGDSHGGVRIPQQVQHVDVLPTVLEFLGLELPEELEGQSLLPLLAGRELPERIAFSKGMNHSMTARDCYVARTEDWKLIWWLEDDRTELFDLKNDPGETHDVSLSEPEVHAELQRALLEHRQERSTSFHLRVPPYDVDSPLEVRLTTTGRFVDFAEANPNAPKRGPATLLSRKGGSLTFTLRPRSKDAWRQPVGFGFDLEPPGSFLEIDIEVEGQALPATSVHLGASGVHPRGLPLAVTDDRSTLRADRQPQFPAWPATSPTPEVFLWESRIESATVHLTEGERNTLEALGYAGEED